MKKSKKLILYEPHRNVNDIVHSNSEEYLFINISKLLRFFKVLKFIKNKKVYEMSISYVLKILSPDAIISCNWITLNQKLFKLHCKTSHCNFIVVQHGVYIGGVIKADHRFINCDYFLVWGPFFKQKFDEYNPLKTQKVKLFGNPIYNSISRENFQYPLKIKKVLFAFSGLIDGNQFYEYEKFALKLCSFGYSVSVKYHNQSTHKFKLDNVQILEGLIYDQIPNFELVVTDHSTVLLDFIFFKRYVAYFKYDNLNTIYGDYLPNMSTYEVLNQNDLEKYLNINKQEELLEYFVTNGNNSLKYIID